MDPAVFFSQGWVSYIYHSKYFFFRYEDGVTKQIALLDWQGTRVNCPAYDVVYTIYSSTLPEIRKVELTNWLKIYHDQFCSDLKAFGYASENVYPFSKFQKDFDDLFEFGFLHGILNSMVS